MNAAVGVCRQPRDFDHTTTGMTKRKKPTYSNAVSNVDAFPQQSLCFAAHDLLTAYTYFVFDAFKYPFARFVFTWMTPLLRFLKG